MYLEFSPEDGKNSAEYSERGNHQIEDGTVEHDSVRGVQVPHVVEPGLVEVTISKHGVPAILIAVARRLPLFPKVGSIEEEHGAEDIRWRHVTLSFMITPRTRLPM